MQTVMLTLHYPQGLRGLPIATTTDPEVLQHFKKAVLQEWQSRIEESEDDGEAMLNRLEYQRLRAALSVFIPDDEDDGEEG
jgi:hypothetical protein